MTKSFVPQDTHVICTMMTNNIPQEIKITTASNVNYKNKDQPLLTINDNKISGSFACKAPASFWGGLQTLALGIALGAACVLTGGLAACVVIGACVVSIGAGSKALWKMAHDCDATKNKKWENVHEKVTFNGEKETALLNDSYLECGKGKGKLTIIMNPQLAHEAAQMISSNNTDQVFTQMKSQFILGFLTSATSVIPGATATINAGVVGLSGVISISTYDFFEDLSTNSGPIIGNTTASVVSDIAGDVINVAIGKSASGVTASTLKGISQNISANTPHIVNAAAASKIAVSGFLKNNPIHEGFGRYLAQRSLQNIKPQKLPIGGTSLASFIASLTIGTIADIHENNLAEETIEIQTLAGVFDNAILNNIVNAININAKKV